MNTTAQICEMLRRSRLLDTLKALPYANELQVFGSMQRGSNPYPNDIDLMIDLRGRRDAEQHSCFDDIPLLNLIHSPAGTMLIDFLAITDTRTRKLFHWGFIDLPEWIGTYGFIDIPTVPLLSVKRWGSAEIFNLC